MLLLELVKLLQGFGRMASVNHLTELGNALYDARWSLYLCRIG